MKKLLLLFLLIFPFFVDASSMYQEIDILENGDKEIITFQLDPTTQEKIILDKELIKKPNENEIENIFSGFLNPKNNTETEMTENDL